MEVNVTNTLKPTPVGKTEGNADSDTVAQAIKYSPNQGMPPLSKKQAEDLVLKHSAKLIAQFGALMK